MLIRPLYKPNLGHINLCIIVYMHSFTHRKLPHSQNPKIHSIHPDCPFARRNVLSYIYCYYVTSISSGENGSLRDPLSSYQVHESSCPTTLYVNLLSVLRPKAVKISLSLYLIVTDKWIGDLFFSNQLGLQKKKKPDKYCVLYVLVLCTIQLMGPLLSYIVFVSIFQHFGFGREIRNLPSNFDGGLGEGILFFPNYMYS